MNDAVGVHKNPGPVDKIRQRWPYT